MVKLIHVDDMPPDVKARAALMGWTVRADAGDAGAWGADADDALANLAKVRASAAIQAERVAAYRSGDIDRALEVHREVMRRHREARKTR